MSKKDTKEFLKIDCSGYMKYLNEIFIPQMLSSVAINYSY